MIKFEANKNFDSVIVLDWSKIEFVDGEEYNRPIKGITLQIVAGGVAELIVERYLMAKDKDGNDITTLNGKNENTLLTHKECYCIEAEGLDNVTFKVVRAKRNKFRDKPTEGKITQKKG
jgi:hypothetical protein